MRTHRRLAAVAGAGTLLLGGAIAQAAVRSGSYSGLTSEKIPITVTISGHKLKNLKTEIGYNGRCGQGGGPGYNINAKQVTIKSNGTFSARITLVGPVKSVPNEPATLKGKASGNTVTGKIVDQSPFLKTAKCNGYTETFTVKRKS